MLYFPWDIDRTFWEILDVDHGVLLRNAIQWATNEPAPLEVAGPGVLDISIWTQKESMTVHLVNLTNPMMMKGPVREILPVGGQRVRINGDHRFTKAHLLVAKKQIPSAENCRLSGMRSNRDRPSRSNRAGVIQVRIAAQPVNAARIPVKEICGVGAK